MRDLAPHDERALLTAPAVDLARWIREGSITSREVVETHIAQTRRVNPRINALVRERFAHARAEADAADAAVVRGETLGPLHGVPCSIKESFALEGMPHSGGLWSRRHHVAEEDAITVARLREAGAIPLGVTNVPELCMWYECHNTIYGRTNNAYHPDHIAGGSSGGEGALVGSGASPFGLGSDIGGSIRMPAFFNGVFGHKPTGGLVPASGQFPKAHGAALRMLATGPLTRRAADLWPLLQLLSGPHEDDPASAHPPETRPTPDTAELRRVYVVEGNDFVRVHPELVESLHRAAEALTRDGAELRVLKLDRLKRSLEIWGAYLSEAGGPSFAELMGGGEAIQPWRELARWSLRRSPHTLPAIVLAMLEVLFETSPARTRAALDAGAALREELHELLDGHAVLLYPPFPSVAPRHYAPLLRPFHFVYTAIVNVMELPATQVPMGLNARGLPLGVQVIGGPHHDGLTIACARRLEEECGGWVLPAHR